MHRDKIQFIWTNCNLLNQVIVFVGLWVLLKIMRGAKWSLVDLSHPGQVIKIFKHLNDIRLGVTQS